MKTFKKLVKILTEKEKTIATMESCTGGAVVNAITCIEGASDVLKFSAVTYSNHYKIKMGVDRNIIDKYTVYSIETAKEMAKVIAHFANANYGVGITGKLNRVDKNNPFWEDNVVFVSIYVRDKNEWVNATVEATKSSRKQNKDLVIKKVIELLENEVGD